MLALDAQVLLHHRRVLGKGHVVHGAARLQEAKPGVERVARPLARR
jgi:hypothetical protein